MSILPETFDQALELIDQCGKANADFIEIRLDGLKIAEGLADLALRGKMPKIATNKLSSHRGKFFGTETEQKQILLAAAKSGFEYVDVDLYSSNLKDFISEAHARGAKIIVSFHDFDGTLQLQELNNVLEREIASGADVCKIVTTAKQTEDNLTLLNFMKAARNRADIVCFAMGEAGKISRLLSPVFGAFFTFAALKRGSESAPGQMTIEEMRSIYKLMGLN